MQIDQTGPWAFDKTGALVHRTIECLNSRLANQAGTIGLHVPSIALPKPEDSARHPDADIQEVQPND